LAGQPNIFLAFPQQAAEVTIVVSFCTCNRATKHGGN